MTVLSVDEAATGRAAVRARLRAADEDCLLLYRLLPAMPGWSGAASWAFELRVAELRTRLVAAHAALTAAGAAL